MKEIWKDVVGYEELYKVSNLVNVYSVRRERLLKPYNNGRGYLQTDFFIGGKRKKLRVNRLVAEAFIPNPYYKEQVNHINEIKDDNRSSNLEWVTAKENANWGSRTSRISKSNSKKIKVIYRDNTYEIWDSATDLAIEFGLSIGNICNVLRGRQKNSIRNAF